MVRRTLGSGLVVTIALAFAAPVHADEVWTGVVKQNPDASDYTVVMRLFDGGGETDYPELKCGGKLTRIAESGAYAFYLEKITSGTGCLDGAITLVNSDDTMTWAWVGVHD